MVTYHFLRISNKGKSGLLGYRICRIITHTDCYLHATSSPEARSVVIRWAKVISEPARLKEVLDHLRTMIRRKRLQQSKHWESHTKEVWKKEFIEHLATIYLPYVKRCTNKIGNLLRKLQVNPVFVTKENMSWSFPKIRSTPNHLNSPGAGNIPCSWGKVYVGQTGSTVTTWIKEYYSCIRRRQWNK